jgi:uncharacterized protein YkwD
MLLLATLLFVAAASWAQSAQTAPWVAEDVAQNASKNLAPDAEQEILRMLNRERQLRGVAPLAASEPLREAARRHSQRMASARQLGHQLAGEAELDRRLGRQRFDVSGENVAIAADAARAHAALMHSPHHRENILDPEYNSVGIGVVRTAQGIYVTQDFAHLLADSSVAQVEEQVAANFNQGRRGGLARVEAPELRRRACEMAAHDRLNPRAGMLPGASGSVAFTALDLAGIPESLRSLRSQPARAFSVGACYQSSASYDNPVFWIIVVTYL